MKKSSVLLPAIGLLVALNAHAEIPSRLLGDADVPADAMRTITITPDTKYVNVTWGEVVDFKVDGQEFAYKFDGAGKVTSFDLQRVAPAGMLAHPVMAYVDITPVP